MAGCKSGVATRINADEPGAIFTHCYGHSLNLACSDAIKRSKLMQDALDTTHEITKLIKKSPGREATFRALRCEATQEFDTPGIRLLCPTRWTVWADSLNSSLENYSILVELWSTALQHTKDTEIKSRIQGVAAQMATFNSYFGSSLALLILRHADNLSKSLQTKDMSAAEGIKSYLRSTMSHQRLNHLNMVLHVHSNHTDKLNLVDVANEFIADNEHRRQVFGNEFKETDL